ncbi:unnamed protein product, partial [Rotaria sp. Silwood1]
VTAQGIVIMRRKNYAGVPSSVLRRSSTPAVDLPILVNEKSTTTNK